MLPHFIVRPGSSEALGFRYDFDSKSTTISRISLNRDRVQRTTVAQVDGLLRYPVAVADGWLCARMPERQFGKPAFVEKWGWDPIEQIERGRIPHEKFGLMYMSASADGELVLVDRAFHASGVQNDALVVRRARMETQATVHPMVSTLVSAAFGDDDELLALIHVDQGGCEARLYDLDGESTTHLGDFAQSQFPSDFVTGAIAFSGERVLVWTLCMYTLESELGLYDVGGERPAFTRKLDHSFEPVFETRPDIESLEPVLSNAVPALAIHDGAAWIGGWGAVHRVPLDGAAPSTIAMPLGVVLQIRCLGDRLIAIDHESALALVPR